MIVACRLLPFLFLLDESAVTLGVGNDFDLLGSRFATSMEVLNMDTGTSHESLVPHSSGDGHTPFLIHEVVVLHGKIPHVDPSVRCRGYTELGAVGVDVVLAADFVGVNGLVATGGEETEGAAPTEATQAICARNSGVSASGDFNTGSASIPFGLQEAGVPRITRCIHFFLQVVVRVPTGGDDRQESYIIEDDGKLLKKRMSRITFVVRR